MPGVLRANCVVKIALVFLAERLDDYEFKVRLCMVEGFR